MNTEIKAKIAQCLSYSMEIEGAIFSHHPESQYVCVYKMVDGIEAWFYRGWYFDGAWDNLDNLISLLTKHIADRA